MVSSVLRRITSIQQAPCEERVVRTMVLCEAMGPSLELPIACWATAELTFAVFLIKVDSLLRM